MVKGQPSQFSVFQIILLIIFIVSLSVGLFWGELEYITIFLAIGFMVLIIYFIRWIINHPPNFVSGDIETGNATLTCKNGHSCRVWVNLNGWDVDDVGESGIIYNIDGHDIRNYSKVSPVCCPECGAEWLVPSKHNGRKR
jgi:hypothetical protein